MAGDGDIIGATARLAMAAGRLGEGSGNLVAFDPPVGRGFGEFPRLAIGSGGVGATFFAVGEAFIDAIAARLAGDDKDLVVGTDAGTGGQNREGGEGNQGEDRFHCAPAKTALLSWVRPKH